MSAVLERSSRGAVSGRQPFHSYHPCIARRSVLPRTNRSSWTTAKAAAVTITEPDVVAQNDVKNVNTSDGSTSPASAPSAHAPETFPWTKQWYPVADVAGLDPSRPHATYLLGIPMALWRDKQGAWHAVEDKCPHRLAPLSEGRVEADGTLQCSYHGWQFNGRGACTNIPQLRGDDKAHAVACSSRRSCVRSFPTQVVHGLLWVLPDSSEEAHEKHAQEPQLPHTAIKELLGGPGSEGVRQATQWYVSELPIRYDTMMENITDPSHVPFSHHGVQGRRENEKGTTTKVADTVRIDGFDFEFDPKRPGSNAVSCKFIAPGYVQYASPIRSLCVYAVPTRPGWSRMIATFLQDTSKPSPLPPVVTAILGLIEKNTWAEHIFQRNTVLDGDTYMLHVQERLLAERKGDWQTGFYMPAAADTSVIAFRRWLSDHGGAVPTCEPDVVMPPLMSKREVLDRYTYHTQNCSHCKKALRNVELATVVAGVCGVLAAVWLAARTIVGLPVLAPATGAGMLVLAASAAAVLLLQRLRQMFYFVDYVHAEKK